MTEFHETIDAVTGEVENREYYTHKEFMQKKRERLAELKQSIDEIASEKARPLMLLEALMLMSEYAKVKACVGPMLKGSD